MRLGLRLIGCALCAGSVYTSCLASQLTSDSSATIQCISSLTSFHAGENFQRTSWELLRDWSNSRGVSIVKRAEWGVWIDAIPVGDSDGETIILSIGIGHTLPDDAVEAGKKAEVLYTSLPSASRAKLPKDGKWVRELMTEDFLSDFVLPIDQVLVLVPRSELHERVGAMLDAITKNRVAWQKN